MQHGPSLSDYLASTPEPQATSPAAPEHLQVRPSTGPLVAPDQQPLAPAAETGTARRHAGLTLIGAALATGGGAWLGGGFGAGAGLLLFGGMRNALRARTAWSAAPPNLAEGTRSATLALFGLGVGGYLGYRAYTRKSSDG